MIYSKGIMWLDDCRIPHNEEINIAVGYTETKQTDNGWGTKNRILKPSNRGRFTPNLLVCDDMLNDGNIGGGGKMKKTGYRVGGKSEVSVGLNGKKDAPDNYGDKGTNSRYYNLDLWFDKMLDKL